MADVERIKLSEALLRAAPVTRMVDYGMREVDAQEVHARVPQEDWNEVLAAIAEAREAEADAAEAAGDYQEAAELWHSAAATQIFAQLSENFDSDRKRSIYRRMTRDFACFAQLGSRNVEKVTVTGPAGRLHGWHFQSGEQVRGAVVIFGGLSGWSTAYRSMAEALCEEGLDCLLVDGPGQGESRLEELVFAGPGIAKAYSSIVDYLLEQMPKGKVGLWGNSFGGLFAGMTSATDARVAACCINGAPDRCVPPTFRTAMEQMAALFGRRDLEGLEPVMAALAYDPSTAPIACPVLVLEGGADPLVALGSQDVFLANNADPRSDKLTWPDGQHTIYNHAAERNWRTAEWFARCLS